MQILKKLKKFNKIYLLLVVFFFYKIINTVNAVELKGNFIQGYHNADKRS